MAVNYYLKDDIINPRLVTEDAEAAAKKFIAGRLTAAQLRRFYGDVKTLELRWQNSRDKDRAFAEILPLIKLLHAKAAYACKRQVVPESFRDWIAENVRAISSERDFKAFLLYFEAVVGFCYGQAKDSYN